MSVINTNIRLTTHLNLINALDYIIDQKLLKLNTMIPGKVISVEGQTATVEIAIKDISFTTGIVNKSLQLKNVPIIQMQYGSTAIITEPQAGDLGLLIFSKKDISDLKERKDSAPPGTLRTFDLSDAVFLPGLVPSKTPDTTITVSDGNIEINVKNKSKITVSDSQIEINEQDVAKVTITNNKIDLTVSGISLGATIKEICDYLLKAMMVPAAPGKPLDPTVAADIAPIIAKLANFGG